MKLPTSNRPATIIAILIATGLGMTGTSRVVAGTVPAGTAVGAQSSDDIPIKSGPGAGSERARAVAPAANQSATPSADWAKAAVQMAQDLIKDGKYPEALAKLADLDKVEGKSGNDVYLIERTRVAIASLTADQALLVRSMEAVMASGYAPLAERLEFSEQLARTYFNQKKYPQAIEWATRYFNDGGKDVALRRGLVFSYYLNGDNARAAQEVGADIRAEEQAGRKPSEEQLRLLVSCTRKLDNKADYASALEKYSAHYPAPK